MNESLVSAVDAEQPYAKSQLGGNTYDTKILGVIWDKKRDEIWLSFLVEETKLLTEEYLRSGHLLTIH